ncbi:MAG: glycosyltransferase, partial [Fulvivirga sp.]|nr:glycosyltransferase [Fulvivirga sp.]
MERTVLSLKTDISFDLVIVDDGSDSINQPNKGEVQSWIKGRNATPHLIGFERNKGVEHALNYGLRYIQNQIKADFILRIDTGDECIGDRINLQYNYLCQHSDVDLVGSWVRYVSV